MDIFQETWPLEDLLSHGAQQTANLTFYKLALQALDRIALDHAPTHEVYRSSSLALLSGFLAAIKPEYRPQAVAAMNLLQKNQTF